MHAIKSHPENNQIMSILCQKTTEKEVKKHCIQHLDAIGSFAYTRQVLLDLEKRLIQQIEELGGNPFLRSLIDGLKAIYHTTN
jgi:geranylgeranyl diphosphate synthase type 3